MSIEKFYNDIFTGYADLLLDEVTSQMEANVAADDELADLKVFEEPPVGITEFVTSKYYLDLGESIYPAGLWVLEMFYNPTKHWDNVTITHPRFGKYQFPGFKALGYTKEQVAQLHFSELILYVGQRSFKSVIAAIISLYEIYKLLVDPNPHDTYHLASGTEITFSIGATSSQQAVDTVYAYVVNFKNQSPWFTNYIGKIRKIKQYGREIYNEIGSEFEFRHKHIVVNAVHARHGGLKGATRKGYVIDEIAFFDEGATQRDAVKVYDALSNSTATFKDNAVKVAISSPSYPLDPINKLYAQCAVKFSSTYYEGRYDILEEIDGDPITTKIGSLGFHFPTWEINPELPYEWFLPHLSSRREATLRDFGALPSMAKSPYIADAAAIEEMFRHPEIDIPVNKLNQLRSDWKVNTDKAVTPVFIHVDKGAGRPSNFGIAAGYGYIGKDQFDKAQLRVRIIFAHSVKADQLLGEVDFKVASDLVRALLKRINKPKYSSDGWNDIEFRQELRREGLCRTVDNILVTEKHYEIYKDLINSGRIECHPCEMGENETKRLELVHGNRVEKGIGFTKDLADCIASVASSCVSTEARKTTATGKATAGVYATT